MSNIYTDLKERFDFNRYWFQSAWEHDPATRIVNNTITGRDPVREAEEARIIVVFGRLLDTLESVPDELLKSIESLRTDIGDERYDNVVVAAMQDIGVSLSATEFAEQLSRLLKEAKMKPVSRKISVYKVQKYDIASDSWVVSRRYATERGVLIMGAQIVEGSEIEIDPTQLERGERWTSTDFMPARNSGFQTVVVG